MKKRMKRVLSLLMCSAIVLTHTITYAEEMVSSTLPAETEVIVDTGSSSGTIYVEIPEPEATAAPPIVEAAATPETLVPEPAAAPTATVPETTAEVGDPTPLPAEPTVPETTAPTESLHEPIENIPTEVPNDVKDMITDSCENIPETSVTGSASGTTSPDGVSTTTSTTTITGSDEDSEYKETISESVSTNPDGSTKTETTVDGEHTITDDEWHDRDYQLDFDKVETGQTATDEGESGSTEWDYTDENGTYHQGDAEYTEGSASGTITDVETTVGDKDFENPNQLPGLEYPDPTYPETEDLKVPSSNKQDYAPEKRPSENGDYYYSGTGADSVYGGVILNEKGEVIKYIDVMQFNLKEYDKENKGKKQVTYCADVNTYTTNGAWYTMENVEDAEYYNDDAAKHIKAITFNGYWGTESGTGSLESIKSALKDYIKANPDCGITEAEVDKLTAGEAQTATQLAIWNYGNHYKYKGQNVTFAASTYNNGSLHNNSYDKVYFDWSIEHGCIGYDENGRAIPLVSINEFDHDEYEKRVERPVKQYNEYLDQQDALSRINKLSAYLIGLADEKEEADKNADSIGSETIPTEVVPEEEKKEPTEILKKDNFIKKIALTIKDKIEDHINNKDDDKTNDAYNVDLSFMLQVNVTSNDDLVLKITNAEGEVIKICRLAGDNSATNYNMITPDENGNYTIPGLELIEGNVSFNMVLQGAQYLEEGVYLYTATKGQNHSQTFVGIASGYNVVDLSSKVDIEFNVDDGEMKFEHNWKNTSKTETPPTEPETEPVTEPETEPESETEPITEPVTEPETEPVTEKQTEPETEPVTEKQTESETEPVTEKQTEPITEKETEPVTEAQTEPVTEKESETEETELITEPETNNTTPNNNIESEAPVEVQSVQTGDSTPFVLMLTLSFVSALIIIACAFYEAKQRRNH